MVGVLLLASCTSGGLVAHTHRSQPAPATSDISTTSRSTEPPMKLAAAPCTWRQLAMTYYGGGAGMGNDFGLIRLRNIAQAPCTLTGPIGLVGLNPTGTDDTMKLIYHTPNALTLTARTARMADGHQAPATSTVAARQIEAEYRDQPHGSPTGLCTKRVIPARWRVTLATGSATIANADRSDPFIAFRRLLTCAGELDAPTPIVSR
jgi:hypothetical protein